jgi:hypothetical protein
MRILPAITLCLIVVAACSTASIAPAGALGAVCGAYAAAFFVAAVQANNSGKCVGVRRLVIGGSVHPVIEKC